MADASSTATQRLWQSSRYLPESARLLGRRYQALFAAHAADTAPDGKHAAVADAMAFADFLLAQKRVALLPREISALRRDARHLSRRFRLVRDGGRLQAVRKGWFRRLAGL